MAANTTIYGVQITLDREYTENTAIGLYTVSNLSYLRWSEATLTSVAEGAGKWATGILLKDGIGDIDASSDLSRGGNVAEYSGLTISVANAEALMQSLKDLQINLTGFSVTVTEFVGTIADSDATSRTVQFTGVVEDIKWGDTTLTIALKNSAYKRETNLSSTNADGVTTPVCFGKLTPPLTKIVDGVSVASTDINNLAKFVRTVDTYDDTLYTNKFWLGTNPEIKIFPVVIKYGGEIYYGVRLNGTISTYIYSDPLDTYAVIVSGTGKGQIRQVTRFLDDAVNNTIEFVIKDAFLTELSVTGDTRSWVQFVKIGREYAADIAKCKGFLRAADGSIILTPELYTFDSDANKFNRVADFGFTVKSNSENNSLDVEGSQYSDDIDTLDSIIILPITSLAKETAANLSGYASALFDLSDYVKRTSTDGLYSESLFHTQFSTIVQVSTDTLDNPEHAFDKDYNSYAEYSPSINALNWVINYAKVLKFGLPPVPKNVTVDKIFVGIKMTTSVPKSINFSGGNIAIVMKRFAFNKSADAIFYDKNIEDAESAGDFITDSLPDFYYETNKPSTNNIDFYRASTISGGKFTSLKGYTLFELVGCNAAEYGSFINGAIIHRAVSDRNTLYVDQMKITEIAIIFKLASSSIKKEIYSPLSGRNYGGIGADTWGTRKTAAALMENPKDIIEHCNRLQNWSEIAGHTVKDWGHEYSSDALIKTSGDGSFDSTNLNYLTDQVAAVSMEITDAAKQTTTAIKKKLCDTFGLCSYIDSSGNECIETLELTNPTGAANTITLTDQIGAIGDIEEPRIENIFCEPIVNYLFNQGSGEYDRTLKVTNIDATAWAAAYTPGFTLADGETVWNSCKVLYNQFRQIETCPSEFSDQCCIADYATAAYYIKRKIAWMGKMWLPTITVDYNKGKDYTLFKHLMVQFPMHTNNVSVECIIEKITKSKNSGTVKIDCVILGSIEDAWYDTSDSTNVKQDTPTLTDPAVIDQ